ncbi:MAG: hypothetical protein ACOCVS_02750 [Planctomycetota bacterium]
MTSALLIGLPPPQRTTDAIAHAGLLGIRPRSNVGTALPGKPDTGDGSR